MFCPKIGSLFLIIISLFLNRDISLANFVKEKTSLSAARAEEDSTTQKRPAPPRRIPPNRVKPGGGLDPSQQSCTNNGESLTALIPVENPVLTTKAYPSFLFYIPDPTEAIARGEFAMFTADEKSRIYNSTIVFPATTTPGIVKITVPPSLEYALQPETYYHWYFRVYCQQTASAGSSLDIDGWVKRVDQNPTSKLQGKTVTNGIWYDEIAKTANELLSSPQNPTARDRWQAMLQYLNLEYLTDRPIFELVLSPNNDAID